MARDEGRSEEPWAAPTFSIITVVLNDAPGLKRTRASLEAQDSTDFEHIIVDGGSTDGTFEYVGELAQSNPRVAFTSGPDEGIYDAMNIGTHLASGALVVFLNAGDALASSDVLTRIGEHWHQHRWHWGRGYTRRLSSEGRARPIFREPMDLQKFIRNRMPVNHQSTAMSRELLARLGGFDTRYSMSADYDAMLRAMVDLGERPAHLPFIWVDYQLGGFSSKHPEIGLWDHHASRARVLALAGVDLAVDKAATRVRIARTLTRMRTRRFAAGISWLPVRP